MPRDVKDLLGEIDRVLASDADRAAVHSATITNTTVFVSLLPLVHRTGRPNSVGPWHEILRSGTLRTSPPTDGECACGMAPAVYFFVGCAAYPKGNVAFVLEQSSAGPGEATFSPFDSGALAGEYLRPVSAEVPWSLEDRAALLQRFCGDLTAVNVFAPYYIAAHFREARTYVTLAQRSSRDFALYHGLSSTTEDRRASTIEARVHHDVLLDPKSNDIRAIVLANRALIDDIPDEFVSHVLLASADSDSESDGDLAASVAKLILDHAAKKEPLS